MTTIITITESTEFKKDYSVRINDDKLFTSFTISKNILDEIKNNPDILPLTSIFNIADQEDFDVSIDSYDKKDYLIQLIYQMEMDIWQRIFHIALKKR